MCCHLVTIILSRAASWWPSYYHVLPPGDHHITTCCLLVTIILSRAASWWPSYYHVLPPGDHHIITFCLLVTIILSRAASWWPSYYHVLPPGDHHITMCCLLVTIILSRAASSWPSYYHVLSPGDHHIITFCHLVTIILPRAATWWPSYYHVLPHGDHHIITCCHLVTVVGVNSSCDWPVAERRWKLLLCLVTDDDDTVPCQCHKTSVTLYPWQKVGLWKWLLISGWTFIGYTRQRVNNFFKHFNWGHSSVIWVRYFFFSIFDTYPPPCNTNNVEPYFFVTLSSRKSDTLPPPTALRNTWMSPL